MYSTDKKKKRRRKFGIGLLVAICIYAIICNVLGIVNNSIPAPVSFTYLTVAIIAILGAASSRAILILPLPLVSTYGIYSYLSDNKDWFQFGAVGIILILNGTHEVWLKQRQNRMDQIANTVSSSNS